MKKDWVREFLKLKLRWSIIGKMMMGRITLSNFTYTNTTDLGGDHLGLRKYDDNPDWEKIYTDFSQEIKNNFIYFSKINSWNKMEVENDLIFWDNNEISFSEKSGGYLIWGSENEWKNVLIIWILESGVGTCYWHPVVMAGVWSGPSLASLQGREEGHDGGPRGPRRVEGHRHALLRPPLGRGKERAQAAIRMWTDHHQTLSLTLIHWWSCLERRNCPDRTLGLRNQSEELRIHHCCNWLHQKLDFHSHHY